MPISEDEYEHQGPTMSKAEQRRNNKPIMEKRRRARINQCLNELKTLILDALKKDPTRHSKLEKADILEMTVKHLQTLQRQQLAVAVATDPSVIQKFKTGFNECANEVTRYIGNLGGIESGVKHRLAAHLSNCVSGIQQQPTSFTIPGSANTSAITITQGNISAQSGDVNNNQNNQNGTQIQVPPGIQLIPSRLPTGELAFLVPNSGNFPFFQTSLNYSTSLTEAAQRSSNSAFSTVKPSKLTTPPLSPASSTTSVDSHTQENFQRPRTPSPRNVSISFPTPPSNSLIQSSIYQEQKPAQQFQISSTSVSPETKNDLGLKMVPNYQPVERHKEPKYKSYVNKSLEPLSIITTTDKSKRIDFSHQNEEKRTFNRKRPITNDPSVDGLLTLANNSEIPQPSTSKYARFSIDDISISSTVSRSPNIPKQPSTSSAQSNNEHMWRPW